MECLYTLYLLSGIIKGFLNFFNLSSYIDFTLLTSCLLIAGLLLHVINKRILKFDTKSIISIYLILIFYSWINIAIFYSPSSYYPYKKSLLFLTNLVAFITPIIYDRFDIRKFCKIFIIASSVLGVLFLVYYSFFLNIFTDDTITEFKMTYLVIAQLSGLCVIIIVVFGDLFSPVFSGLLFMISFGTVILTGGRAPIIFTATVLFLYINRNFFSNLIGSQKNKYNRATKLWKTKHIILIIMITCFIFFLMVLFVPNVQMLAGYAYLRMTLLFGYALEGLDEQSLMVRVDHLTTSYNLIFHHAKGFLFGYGWGSYGIVSGGSDERWYPHNMILEIWVETGLVGLVLFLIFLIYTCRRNFKNNPFSWVFLFLFLNVMKSSSLVDLRLFFGFLAIVEVYSKRKVISGVEVPNMGLLIRRTLDNKA